MNDSSEAKTSRSSTPVPVNGEAVEAGRIPAHSHSRSTSHHSLTAASKKSERSAMVAGVDTADLDGKDQSPFTSPSSSSEVSRGSLNNGRPTRSYGSTDSTENSRAGGEAVSRDNRPSVVAEPKRLSSVSGEEDEELLRRQKRQWLYIIPMICIGMFGIMTIIPNLPDVLTDTFGDDLSVFIWSGVADSGNALLSFLAAPWLGRLSDATGRNKIMFLSTLALLLPFAAVGVGLNGWWYVGLRIACGFFAVNVSIALAYIADVSPRDKQSARYGMALALMSLAVIVGSLAGATAPFDGIRWAAPIIVVLVAGYVLFILPESLLLKNRLPLREARQYHNPITNAKVLKTGGSTAGLTAMLALSGFADAGFQATTFIYLSVRFDWDAQRIGTWTALGAAISAIHSALLRYYVRRWHERTVILASLAITFVGYILYGLATEDYQLYAIVVLSSMRYILQPAASSLIAREVGPDRKGTILATANAVRDFFSICGPFAFGALSGALQSSNQEKARSFHFFLGAFFYLMGIVATWKYTSTKDFSYSTSKGALLVDDYQEESPQDDAQTA